VPSNGEGRAPRQRPGPAPTTTTASLPHRGDPQRIGELLNDWLAIQMDRVDSLTAEAESKVAAIPDQRHLWLMLGETLVRLHCVELELAELKRGRRR
jgi:cytochrome c-type biogenesis protein CcmH/NrfG